MILCCHVSEKLYFGDQDCLPQTTISIHIGVHIQEIGVSNAFNTNSLSGIYQIFPLMSKMLNATYRVKGQRRVEAHNMPCSPDLMQKVKLNHAEPQ